MGWLQLPASRAPQRLAQVLQGVSAPAVWREAAHHVPIVGGWAPSRVCVGADHLSNTTAWCVDNCMDHYTEECSVACTCKLWAPDLVDSLLGLTGALATVTCLVVLGLDLWGPSSGRTPTQASCLHWSNVCNLFYSLFFVFYAVADQHHPFSEPGGMKQCGDAWAGFIGKASCHGPEQESLCFLNCCIVAVPWLEFFGYGSLLWNIFWLLDLTRFTYSPLSPEKFCGVPCKTWYHGLTWAAAALIAVNWDASRLDTTKCRQSYIVMMPCLLRKGNIKQDVPWIHLIGLGIAGVAVLVLARRYATMDGSSRRDLGLRPYLRRQWRHAACLVACWIAILVDTCRRCEDVVMSYITAVFFAGLGFFLGVDRLIIVWQARHRRSHQLQGVFAGQHMGDTSSSTAVVTTQSVASAISDPSGSESEVCRLMDIDGIIGCIASFLECERQKSQAISSDASRESKLQQLADIEDGELQLGHNTFKAMSAWTFSYLRCLWGVDEERLVEQLRLSQGTLESCFARSSAKSGSSILTSPDGRTFVLKTISEEDRNSLRTLLPAYRHHFQRNASSALCQVYGCYSLRNSLGSKLHVALMECLTAGPAAWCSMGKDPPVSRTFDIKSEFQDRGFCSRFPGGLQLCKADGLCETSLQQDFMFLSGVGVVDYSVLITLWDLGLGAVDDPEMAVCCEVPFHVVWCNGASDWSTAVMRVGIIDFFQAFNARKLAESVLKRRLLHPRHPAERVTIVHPQLYAERQLDFVSKRVLRWAAPGPGIKEEEEEEQDMEDEEVGDGSTSR